jgi:ABC-2 type transport system permease protein
MRGLWPLTWLEIKIFVREPLGLFGALVVPVLMFLVLGRLMRNAEGPAASESPFLASGGLPVLAAIVIATSAVVSLVTIIAIYREGGILKRLRATPLRPATILTAHVIVKLAFTALTLALLLAVGRRYATASPGQVAPFVAAVLFSTAGILSIGFLIASLVPTARFAQPVAGLIFYPMIALSGLFFPIAALPPWLRTVARAMPLTYMVSLLQGVWRGDPLSSHLLDLAVIALFGAVFTALAARVFRWE